MSIFWWIVVVVLYVFAAFITLIWLATTLDVFAKLLRGRDTRPWLLLWLMLLGLAIVLAFSRG